MQDPKNTNPEVQPNYWRSLEELSREPEFFERRAHEFMQGASDGIDLNSMSSVNRRKFLALLSTSVAFAAAGCSNPLEKTAGKIVSYNRMSAGMVLGKPNYYASTCTACQDRCGTLVKTREGRPIKIDGNPDHPVSKGKICSTAQASVLDLYDPARIRNPQIRKGDTLVDSDWQEVDAQILSALKEGATQGKSAALVTHRIFSPTEAKAIQAFLQKYPHVRHVNYELMHGRSLASAVKFSFGLDEIPVFDLQKAEIILSLDSDFLGTEPGKIERNRHFAARREAVNKLSFNRLYAAEGAVSLTGANADYRLEIQPSRLFDLVMGLIHEIVFVRKSIAYAAPLLSNPDLVKLFESYPLLEVAKDLNQKYLKQLVEDLLANMGKSAVLTGVTLPLDTQIAALALNQVIGASSLYLKDAADQVATLSAYSQIQELVTDMAQGKVDLVLHYDCNPLFHFPEKLAYASALQKVKSVVSLSEMPNETTHVSTHVLPIHHMLESFGDHLARNPVLSLQQPVIQPIYKTRQKEALLLHWTEEKEFSEGAYLAFLKARWQKEVHPQLATSVGFELFFNACLHDGLVLLPQKTRAWEWKVDGLMTLLDRKPVKPTGLVLEFKQSYYLGDGRFASNGWLQELPHPVSKIVWDNYAAVSVALAAQLKVKTGEKISITLPSGKFEAPVLIQPGQAEGVVSIELGNGRSAGSIVALGNGFNPNPWLQPETSSVWIYEGVKVEPFAGVYDLVSTQDHHVIDPAADLASRGEKKGLAGKYAEMTQNAHENRELIHESTVENFVKSPAFLREKLKHKSHIKSIYPEQKWDAVKWAMTIDLNKCTGCNQCTVACNVENNIPVVGKDQVKKGREMHWMRIDRYYSGPSDKAKIHFQPMLCQHCDNAPCENVCPVAATDHTPDGLNDMAYNRCVGTRYCANNCPYKVRRFNFFDFRVQFKNAHYEKQPVDLLHNPEVTVRSRGVMEKCTFCVQRIMDSRAEAKKEKRAIRGSDVTVACQDACPTRAIEFGNMHDPESPVSIRRSHALNYQVLDELAIKPNVTYIARLRNVSGEVSHE